MYYLDIVSSQGFLALFTAMFLGFVVGFLFGMGAKGEDEN